ncbi:GNAT family N-acetyltransferase [Idiomarina sp. UBA3162]|uniref:GNAT family N-acetyltransferase n=1 Tax=Idiomarina sp. UBA3162 TaxID=1946641 RepID=UPI000C89886B|nr:N-acetyltransferase [Idiomarina sp. UBA3162]MAD54230.1 GNAT family N-acetyltransferase [Idiomarinaceae bacterium]|tara:strand:+ start:10325 stop:10801 length:477 start_codon:yes stop_codon:yes gene_type:complete
MNTNCGFKIDPCQRSDITALVELENQVFDYSRISRRNFIRLLQSPAAFILLAKDSADQLAGYAVILTRRNSRYARIYSIAVAPAFRGQGVAKLLVNEVIKTQRQQDRLGLSLEVKLDNKQAIQLYQSLGFETVDILVNYYDDGTDGLKMRLTFDPESH